MSNDTMHGCLCVFRYSPDKPWMPIGLLRNEIREGITSQHERLTEYLLDSISARRDLGPAVRAQRLRDIRKWARQWGDIHDRNRTETYTDPAGREYGLLRMTVTPAGNGDVTFTDPHAAG
jgi:hypothetical protein